MVLPVLGGSPAVWSIALVFFQALLLAGYCYAHLLARYASTGAALALHLALMLGAGLTLPMAIPAGWTSAPADGEAFWSSPSATKLSSGRRRSRASRSGARRWR